MASALTRFYASHPAIDGIALDTIRDCGDKTIKRDVTCTRCGKRKPQHYSGLMCYRDADVQFRKPHTGKAVR